MMQKMFGALLFLCLSLQVAHAADESAVVSLFEGTSEAVGTQKKGKAGDASSQDGGILSFLNFKPFKKEAPKLNIADKERLSAFEQSVKLAEKGDVNAQLFLGYSYLYGENGAAVDYDKAFEYYAMAALQNDSVGLNNLGSLYYSGIGVERNQAKAAILFQKAADLGNNEARVNLAFILISGNGVEAQPAKAMDLFAQAAADDNLTAKFMLGYAYYTGKLRPQDYKKAAEMIRAAAADFDEAQYVLAVMYMSGLGLPQNYGNAVKYLRQAVAQGNVEAMTALGDILARGEKYNQDLFTAHVMFNLAAVRGAPGAAEKRRVLEERMKIEEVLQAQAMAEQFREKPSALTAYIRQTFGRGVRTYVDKAE